MKCQVGCRSFWRMWIKSLRERSEKSSSFPDCHFILMLFWWGERKINRTDGYSSMQESIRYSGWLPYDCATITHDGSNCSRADGKPSQSGISCTTSNRSAFARARWSISLINREPFARITRFVVIITKRLTSCSFRTLPWENSILSSKTP